MTNEFLGFDRTTQTYWGQVLRCSARLRLYGFS